MNMLGKITPWPWKLDGIGDIWPPQEGHFKSNRGCIAVGTFDGDAAPERIERLNNMALIALAPDHALLLAAMTADLADYNSATDGGRSGVIVGKRFDLVNLDPFGCPILTDELRASLKLALGLAP